VIALRFLAGAGLTASAGSVALGTLVARVPRIVGLAVETWVAPWPHAMRLLAWETSQPFPLAQALAAALPLLAVVLFLVRGELRRATLVVGAVAVLTPVVLVCDSFWLGFDRYLYLPAILCVAAALPLTGGGRFWAVATVLVALGLGVATFDAARAYRSHGDFAAAILADRPDEPTGYLLAADDAVDQGRVAQAAAYVDSVPTWDLPAPVAHHAAGLLLRLGRGPEAAALVERTAQAAPSNENLQFDLLTVRAAQHRWPEVIQLARVLAADPARRRAIANAAHDWAIAGQIPPHVAAELQALVGPGGGP